ncbi:MAG: hypothetical protein MMC33_010332 [Icmadophila ericetorum]|nr:hypothetical protein [Icmadophila ericetorum]
MNFPGPLISIDGGTALALAASRGHIKVVEILLIAGADVNDVSNKHAALQRAAASGNLGVVERLLAAGAHIIPDPSKSDLDPAFPSNPVESAAKLGHLEAVDRLLAAGSSTQLALHAAINYNQIKVVERLLEAGVDIGAVGFSRRTPLKQAKKQGHTELIKILRAAAAVDRAANVPARRTYGGFSLPFQ